jgi:hypothetical protein
MCFWVVYVLCCVLYTGYGPDRRPAPGRCLSCLGIRLNSVMLAFLVMGGSAW